MVSPIDPKAAAQRYLERHRGPGGYMLLVQSERLDIDRARLEMGVRTDWKLDLADIRGTHLHPKDTGGTLLSIDDATPPASWRWAGPIWEKRVRTTIVDAIVAADLQSEDPRTLAQRWSEILDQPFHDVAPDHYEMRSESGRIRFVADRDGCGEGLRSLDLRAVDRGAALTAARAWAAGRRRSRDDLRRERRARLSGCAPDHSSRCTVAGENAGRQIATYSAPPASGLE